MDWLLLLFAGAFEVGMTFCLGKTRGAEGFEFCLWAGGFLISAALSMGLLAKASQTLPLGTAYAVWTGIGALGSVIIGIVIFKEPVTAARIFFAALLLAGIVGLKLTSA